MAEASDLSIESIAIAATEPSSASVDGQSASAVSIADQLAALNAKKAAAAIAGANSNGGRKTGWRGLRIAKAVPPSAD